MLRTWLLLLSVFVNPLLTSVAAVSPSFQLEGELFDDATGMPIKESGLGIKVSILGGTGSCILYEEFHTGINTISTQGRYELRVGSSLTNDPKRTALDDGNTMREIYQNTVAISGKLPDGSACTYTPSASDGRRVRISVTRPGLSEVVLTPDLALGSVPQAVVAQTVAGYSANQLAILGAGDLTQANLQDVFASGNALKLLGLLAHNPSDYVRANQTSVQLPPLAGEPATKQAGHIWYDSGVLKFWNGSSDQVLGVSGAGISSLTMGAGLLADGTASATVTAPSTLAVDVGTTAGKIVQLDGSARLPAVNASQLTNLSGTQIQSGTIGGSTAISTTGNLQTSGNIQATGSLSGSQLTLFENSGAGPDSISVRAPNSVTSTYSMTLPNSAPTTGQALRESSVAGVLEWFTPSSGTVTGVTASAPLSVSGTAQAPVIEIATANGTTAGALTAADWTTFNSKVSRAGDTMTGALNLPSNGLVVGTSQLVASGGNVGIGTVSPASNLDIVINETGGLSLTDSAASNGRLTIGEGTTTANLFAPTFSGTSIGVNRSTSFISQVLPGEDSGTTPTMVFSTRRSDASNIVTRPAYDFRNYTTSLMTVLADGKIGIGTTDPQVTLDVLSRTPSSAVSPNRAGINLMSEGTDVGARYMARHVGSGLPQFVGARANGTLAAPTATANDNNLVEFSGMGFDGTNWYTGGAIQIRSSESASSSARGTLMRFFTTALGETTNAERVRIDPSGNVGIGTVTPTAALHLKAGTANEGGAPLKLTSGTNLTTPENGAIEFDGNDLFFTSLGVRRTIASASGGTTTNLTNITNTGGSVTVTPAAGNSLIVNQSTVSTSSSTGALIVNGGAGIGGALNVAGNISGSANITAGTAVYSPLIYGGTTSSQSLIIDSTSHGTKGPILIAPVGGNVGIGTTSPSRNFVTYSSSGNTFNSVVSNDTGVAGLILGDVSNDARGQVRYDNSDDSLSLYTAGGERVRISSTGSVGIGTTIPLMALHVQSTTTNGIMARTSGADSTAAMALQNDARRWDLAIRGDDGDKFYISDTTAGLNRLAIDTSGNVGIGTQSPNSRFHSFTANAGPGAISTFETSATTNSSITVKNGTTHVNFGIGSTTPHPYIWSLSDDFYIGSDGNPSLYVDGMNGGNIGIGTTSPSSKLHVASSGAAAVVVTDRTDGKFIADFAGAAVAGQAFDNSGDYAISSQSRTNIGTTTGLTYNVYVQGSTGNVGIGSTSPTAKLDVNGEARATRVAINGGAVAGNTYLAVSDGRTSFDWSGATSPLTLTSHTSGSAINDVLDLQRRRTTTTPPSTGFGGNINHNLEGFTDGAMMTGARVTYGWEVAQTNDTTDRDAYYSISTMQDNSLGEKLRITANGSVGIGTTSPVAKLQVAGSIVPAQNEISSGASVDLSLGNTHILSSVGGSTITLTNGVDGGQYTVIIRDTTSRTYTFSGCTTSLFSPGNGPTLSGTHSLYSILMVSVSGARVCYISWITGFE